MASLIFNMDVDYEKLLICKMDMDCVKALHFDTEVIWGVQIRFLLFSLFFLVFEKYEDFVILF